MKYLNKEPTCVVTKSFLYRVKQYIEETEVCLDQDFYEGRSLEELNKSHLMPLIYNETLEFLNIKEDYYEENK